MRSIKFYCIIIVPISILLLVIIITLISELSAASSQVISNSIPRLSVSDVRINPGVNNSGEIFTDSSACAEAFQSVDAKKKHCFMYHPYVDLRDHLKHEEALLQLRNSQDPPVIPLLLREYPIQENHTILTRCGYKGGDVKSQVNQDRAIIVSPFLIHGKGAIKSTDDTPSSLNFIMGIFDGHGESGHHVAQHAAHTLPKQLAKNLDLAESHNVSDIQNALVQSFITVDTTIPQNERTSGCTASVILRLQSKIYIANAGDSQSYIVSYHKQTHIVQIVYITRKDKPDLIDERKRIEAAGGNVFIPPKPYPGKKPLTSRVLIPTLSIGIVGLAMSRSIGDHDGKTIGVIAEPIVDVLNIHSLKAVAGAHHDVSLQGDSKTDDNVELFAVSVSDGLLDYIEPLDIARYLAKSLYREAGGDAPSVMEACGYLIRQSSKMWIKDFGYRDDISIAVNKIET